MSEQQLISVVGEFEYPHLNKPDVRVNEAGEYKVTLNNSILVLFTKVWYQRQTLNVCMNGL